MRITYLDASVLLRAILGEPDALPQPLPRHRISSGIVRVECFRAVDRGRLIDRLPESEIEKRRAAVHDLLQRVVLIGVTHDVLSRAALPLPVHLKTLDAIHLATAMLWREQNDVDIDFATHDLALAAAAREVGFTVVGT